MEEKFQYQQEHKVNPNYHYPMQTVIHQWAFGGSFEQLVALPRQELVFDWYGDDTTPPLTFAFATDGTHLWFLAARATPAMPHPSGESGAFTPELWKYDVAEFFAYNPATARYWELNLSPTGAWWAAAFSTVRVADDSTPAPTGVQTLARAEGSGWVTMMCIPLASLAGLDIRDCTLATTAILCTPNQIFLTTADDLAGEPDFHRPATFPSPIFK